MPQSIQKTISASSSTLFRSMGVDLKVIQEIMGHGNVDVTANTYLHVLPSMQQDLIKRIDRLFQWSVLRLKLSKSIRF